VSSDWHKTGTLCRLAEFVMHFILSSPKSHLFENATGIVDSILLNCKLNLNSKDRHLEPAQYQNFASIKRYQKVIGIVKRQQNPTITYLVSTY